MQVDHTCNPSCTDDEHYIPVWGWYIPDGRGYFLPPEKMEESMTNWRQEREDVLAMFQLMLEDATGDGNTKRQAGLKPPWYEDPDHEAAIFSHLNKWKHGEIVDPDSGTHPLVHGAWRMLAIAYQELYGQHSPRRYLEEK